MADEAQVKILKQGVLAWNKWRKTNLEIQPDLSGAHLYGMHLQEANLSWASLDGAHLGKANLSRAYLRQTHCQETDLHWADLSGTELNGAQLCGADLGGADLSRADLSGADLTGANLYLSNLTEADLTNADFSNCIMDSTQLTNVDFSRAKGLEMVNHRYPSIVGIDTIYRSSGNIPEVFLRGAGVPEPFIANMKSLVAAMSPIEFYSCFISYSSKDQEFAERLHADLRGKNVRCWFAPEDLKIGDPLRRSFDEAIRVHDKLMVLLSQNSVGSPWVEKEVESAFEKEHQQNRTVLFPIRLDEAVMNTDQAWAADIRRTRHIGDFRDWKNHDSYKKSFDRLLRDLKAV